VGEIRPLKLADDGAVAALAHVEHRVLRDVVHEAHAPGAQDAAVRDVDHVSAEVLDRVEALGFLVAGVLAALGEGVILQLALPRLIADRAVERVIDEQELEHALACLSGLLRVHVHHLPLGDGGGARRRELRHLLHFDEAHPTQAGHRQRRVVAVVRDQYAGVLGGLEDRGAGRHGDWPPLDREIDERW
jgi:hypothetical protein